MNEEITQPGFDLGPTIWEARDELVSRRDRFTQLREVVGSPQDLTPGQWLQLYATCRSFEPDLILELGRGYGNSTCVFTEAANSMRSTQVISVSINGGWEERTLPRLRDFVPHDWFKNLEVIRKDIRRIDFKPVTDSFHRLLLFWDAHGHDLAAFILAELMPLLAPNDHLVCVHDVADARYQPVERHYTREDGLPSYWADPFVSAFPEILYIHDFVCRNGLIAESPLHSIDGWLKSAGTASDKIADFNHKFGPSSPLSEGGWIYFSATGATEFPDRATLLDRYDPRSDPAVAERVFRPTPRFILGTAKRAALARLRRRQDQA